MTDAMFLDDFLHSLDDSVAGTELVHSLDKADIDALPEFDLQLVDIFPINATPAQDQDQDQEQDQEQDQDRHSTCTSDTDCASEGVASSVSTPPVAVENVRSKDAIRRRIYREKQKAQKDALYQQVGELTTRLSTLQKQQQILKSTRGLGVATQKVWEALANRHLQARLMAEEQNTRLQEAVHRRAELIQSLASLVHKRIGEEQVDRELDRPRKRVRSDCPDRALFETYIGELDDVYARLDDVFQHTTITCSGDPFHRLRPSISTPKDSSYHELVGQWVTPFAFDRVKKYISEIHCMEYRMDDREFYDGDCLPPGTSVVKARIPGPEGVTPARSLMQYAIMRKYYESDRVVAICRKFTEGEGAFAGMHSDETGWCIIRPSSASVEGGAGTVMESVLRYVPMTFSSAVGSAALLKQFTDLILQAGEEDCQRSCTKLEGLLLDDALGVC